MRKDEVLSRTFVHDKGGFKYIEDKHEEGKDIIYKPDTRFGCKAKMTINLEKFRKVDSQII